MANNFEQKERQLDKTVRQFAQKTLKPDEKIKSEVNQKRLEIEKLLKESKSRHTIDRIIVSGSFGKNTHIEGFDIDTVVFLNKTAPEMFDEVLLEWYEILRSKGKYDKVEVKPPYMLTLKAGEYAIDLLPAHNFASQVSGDKLETQFTEALKKIVNDNSENQGHGHRANSQYSTSLAEYQVNYIKKQSSFINQLIRLCKYWRSVYFADLKIPGFSLTIEMIAAHVGKAEEAEKEILMVRAFRKFLTLISNFGTIAIEHGIPKTTLTAAGINKIKPCPLPYIMDPANPWNNLGIKFTPALQKYLGDKAKETLESLKNLIETNPGCTETQMKTALFRK